MFIQTVVGVDATTSKMRSLTFSELGLKMSIYGVKLRHNDLLSQYDLNFVGQNGVACSVKRRIDNNLFPSLILSQPYFGSCSSKYHNWRGH